MTIRYTADVFCDVCGQWVHGLTKDSPYGMARPALKKAKKLGWSRDNRSTYLDVCPDCLAKVRSAVDA